LKQTNILADTSAQNLITHPSAKRSEQADHPERDLVPRALTSEERLRTCEDLMAAG